MNEKYYITKYQRDLVAQDICPRCRAELDTGWECLKCGYDAKWIADQELQEIESPKK